MNLDYNVFAVDYRRNVGSASPTAVSQFIGRMKDDMEGEVDHDALYEEFPESYTTIMDALGMWEAGAAHARKLMKEQK
jgi:hypothetical protein